MRLNPPRTLQIYGARYVRASLAYEQARQQIGALADQATADIRTRRGGSARIGWIEQLRQQQKNLEQTSQLSAREQDSLAAYTQSRVEALPQVADIPASSGIGVEQHRPEAVSRREPAPMFPPLRTRTNLV